MLIGDYISPYCRSDLLRETVDKAVERILRSKVRFGNIVVTGCSGLLIGAPVAAALKKDLIIVRKERSHSDETVEGFVKKTYIILDDFIDSGASVGYMINEMESLEENLGFRPKCSGMYFYSHAPFDREEFEDNLLRWIDNSVSFASALVMDSSRAYRL